MSAFIDEIIVTARAGDGGAGAVAFRREKFIPHGGPAGGDGGKGGDVIFQATQAQNTLFDLRYRRILKAEKGRPGGAKNMHGRGGDDLTVLIPTGTLVYDADTNEILVDLVEDGQCFVVARGGRGGRGNARFVTARNQTPRRADPGETAETRDIRLELKLLADVGLLGYPSVGKSTLITQISNARPKIAEYHFTTLTPNLGVVRWKNYVEFVVADIPGLIEGASEGLGLGHQFLKHVERTRLLVHLIEVTPQLDGQEDGRDPIEDFHRINRELEAFAPELAKRDQVIALNKIDQLATQERAEELRAYFEALHLPFFVISAATGEGVAALVDHVGSWVVAQKAERPQRSVSSL